MIIYKHNITKNIIIFFIYLLSFIAIPCISFAEAPNSIRLQNISIEDGLSKSTVTKIFKDDNGIMLIGTSNGLNIYDGYKFTVFKTDASDKKSISGNEVQDIYKAKDGTYWIATSNGLNRFDIQSRAFTRYMHEPSNPDSISYNEINKIAEDKDGNLWMATNGGGLEQFNRVTGKFKHFKNDPGNNRSISSNTVTALLVDKDILWVATDKGLDKYESETGYFIPVRESETEGKYIYSIYEDKKNSLLWLGMSKEGIKIISSGKGNENSARHIQENLGMLNDKDIYSIFEDSIHQVWIGTDQGLYQYNPVDQSVLEYNNSTQNSMKGKSVLDVNEDNRGNLWIGLYRDGINIYKVTNFINYTNDVKNDKSLSNDIVNSIYQDPEGIVWVGTDQGLNQFDKMTQTFKHFNDFNGKNLGTVYCAFEDSYGNFWVGTYNFGLLTFDKKTGKFTESGINWGNANENSSVVYHILEDHQKNLWVAADSGLVKIDPSTKKYTKVPLENSGDKAKNTSIDRLFEDKQNNLWIGTDDQGLYRLNIRTGETKQFKFDPQNNKSISSNTVYAMEEDADGSLWIGTDDGIDRFDAVNESFKRYPKASRIASKYICGILSDKNKNLWISTDNGLVKFNPQNESFKIYDINDGIESNEFIAGAYCKAHDGEFIFGSIKGILCFVPEKITEMSVRPNLVITSLKTDNQSFFFPKTPSQLPFKINYRQNYFEVEFAVADFKNPLKNQFAYKLEGYDKDWVYAGNMNKVRFSNLKGGKYTLVVKGANSDGIWSKEKNIGDIWVDTPPWQTWWAYTGYVAMFLMLIILLYLYRNRRHAKELEKERAISERLLKLDKIKDEFMANTSHELRTPLHGIIGIAESMLEGAAGKVTPIMENNLSMIVISSKRLSTLINDIVDFSKLKNHELTIKKMTVDIRQLTEVVLTLSRPLIGPKDLILKNEIPDDIPCVLGDEDRLQQILYNLVGNAIKFTKSGSVIVKARQKGRQIEIAVEDSGIGIAPENLDSIFNFFEQADNSISREYGGTGLGLSITKKLVELHGGEIWVNSQPGNGSTFTFSLPASNETIEVHNTVIMHSDMPEKALIDKIIHTDTKSIESSKGIDTVARILVVDDDSINRQVIVNQLSLEKYHIRTATNGMEALKTLQKERFDLILLDIMMPKMSGYDVLKKLREEHSLYDLPVILITAKNQPEDIIAGFSMGANDYLSKPFNQQELKARVSTWVQLKKAAQFALTAEVYYLQEQIKPHFLYNTLNTIMSFVRIDPEKARELLIELSNYLRESLRFKNMEQFMPIEREINLVRSYLFIEMARFSDKLNAEFDIDEDIYCTIPHLIIQPLVENAVKHGILPVKGGGTVKVRVKDEEDHTLLEIEDDGVGIENEKIPLLLEGKIKTTGNGIGLYNVNKRLKSIYGEGVNIESIPNKGTIISFKIPKKAS